MRTVEEAVKAVTTPRATGKVSVNTYRAVVIKQAIKLYRHTGMKANRAYTPTNMARVASQITGKGPFTRFQLREAQEALEAFIAENRP